jgi:hypothetical protein
MMELSILAPKAVSIVLYMLDKVSGGALEKAGADVLDLLKRRFEGKLRVEDTKGEPKLLEATIISEAQRDKDFQVHLERLVTQFERVQNNSSETYQNTESGVNVNVNNNPGTVIGQKIDKQIFR